MDRVRVEVRMYRVRLKVIDRVSVKGMYRVRFEVEGIGLEFEAYR